MKLLAVIFCLLTTFSIFTFAQTSSSNEGVVFKIPGDVFPMDWKKNDFKGILMLKKDSPSGIFITYPNDAEKIEDLKLRAAKAIAPMFGGGKKEEINFQKSAIPNHKGDSGNSGAYYLHSSEKNTVQILIYERRANGKDFIYGYFAMKGNEVKNESVKNIWADEKGQGIKIFEDFWRTFKD